jgi:hypothetical protein
VLNERHYKIHRRLEIRMVPGSDCNDLHEAMKSQSVITGDDIIASRFGF